MNEIRFIGLRPVHKLSGLKLASASRNPTHWDSVYSRLFDPHSHPNKANNRRIVVFIVVGILTPDLAEALGTINNEETLILSPLPNFS